MSRLLLCLPILAFAAAANAAVTAVAVTPQRTTVAGGETRAFAVAFYDAQGRPAVGEKIRFFNDACGTFPGGGFLGQATTDSNGIASIDFTALDTGFIRCTVTASPVTGAGVQFEVTTFKADPRVVTIATEMSPVEPRPGQHVQIFASAKLAQFVLYDVDIAAKIVPAGASATLPSAKFNTGQEGVTRIDVSPDGRWGDFDLELSYVGKVVRVPVKMPANPIQDLWWSGSVENGWGMSIVQHRDMLFTIVYAYDDAGNPTWYVMPSGEWNAAHTAFTGDVFVPKGAPYSNYDAARFDIGPSLGRATITFDGANAASLDYNLRGLSGHKSLTRILFGQGRASTLANLGDMWWGGTTQNGWGFSVLQQGADLFTLWFTYDETGNATWFAMPAGSWMDARSYRGTLYRSSGSPWLGKQYDASQFHMNDIGWYAMRFNEDGGATFQYSIGGGAVRTLPLTRIPF